MSPLARHEGPGADLCDALGLIVQRMLELSYDDVAVISECFRDFGLCNAHEIESRVRLIEEILLGETHA